MADHKDHEDGGVCADDHLMSFGKSRDARQGEPY